MRERWLLQLQRKLFWCAGVIIGDADRSLQLELDASRYSRFFGRFLSLLR